jgi:hypothetical protein
MMNGERGFRMTGSVTFAAFLKGDVFHLVPFEGAATAIHARSRANP